MVPDRGAERARLLFGSDDLRRVLERRDPQPRGVRERRQRAVGNRAHETVDADLATEIRLGGGQVRLGLEQRDPRVAEVHGRAQRVRARRRAGMQLVDRDSQLLPRAVQLRFRDAHQLLVGQRVVEGLLRLKRHLILLIGVPGVRGGFHDVDGNDLAR